MSYNIMRTAKIKDRQAITSAASHNFRIRQQGNIDASRTPQSGSVEPDESKPDKSRRTSESDHGPI